MVVWIRSNRRRTRSGRGRGREGGLPPFAGWLKLGKGLGDESGTATVVAAALIPVMLLMAFVLHDVTVIYAARSQAQTAADAAAKAAGLELTPLFGVGNDPSGAARDFAARNGAELLACDLGRDGRFLWVTVRTARKVRGLFLKPAGAVVTATARCYLDPFPRGGP